MSYIIGSAQCLTEFTKSHNMFKGLNIIGVDMDIYDCLVDGEFFKSRNQAKKNFKKEVKQGLNVFTIGKYKKTLIVYNCS